MCVWQWRETKGGHLSGSYFRRITGMTATANGHRYLAHTRNAQGQPTPVLLPGESQGQGSLVGCCLGSQRVGHDWSDLAAAEMLLDPWSYLNLSITWEKGKVTAVDGWGKGDAEKLGHELQLAQLVNESVKSSNPDSSPAFVTCAFICVLLLYSAAFWKAGFWEGMGWDGGLWLHEYLNMCHFHSPDYILLLLLHPPCPSKNNRQDPKETSVVTDLKEASLVKSTLEPYSAMFPHFKPEAQIFPLSKLSRNHLDRISCEM